MCLTVSRRHFGISCVLGNSLSLDLGGRSLFQWRVIWVPVEIIRIPSRLSNVSRHLRTWRSDVYRCHSDLSDFRDIIFVINTVPKDVAKIAKSSLQSIGGALFFRLFESCGFSLTVFNVAISNILLGLSRRKQGLA